jgi:DNA-directed RNA polymerase specialized sigma subunit
MRYTNKDILNKLQGFNALERRKQQLEFELENYIEKISGEDVIESQTFKSGVGEFFSGGRTSDITASLAVSYADKAAMINIQDKQTIQETLRLVELEIKRLTYYVSLLDESKAAVIRVHYFEGCTLPQTAVRLEISISTMRRRLKSAVMELTSM